MIPDLVRRMRAVQQEHRTVRRILEQFDLVDQVELVAGDEICGLNQVRRMNRLRPKTQMRYRARTGLLRVIDEVALAMQVGVLANDLDAVLVRADRAVGTHAEKQRARDAFALRSGRTGRTPGWCA